MFSRVQYITFVIVWGCFATAPCLQNFSQTQLFAVLVIGLVQVRLKTFTDSFIHLDVFGCHNNAYKKSSGDEIANVNFCTTTSYNTSKYTSLLNIQHDAGRSAASGCGLVLLVRKALKARRLATTEYSCSPRSRVQHGHGLLPVQQSRGRATMAD